MQIGSQVILRDNGLHGTIESTVGGRWIVKVERATGGSPFWVVLSESELEEVGE